MEAIVQSMQAKEHQQRYDALDALKCICSFLVVLIHVPFYGDIGEYCKAISRIAVPIFFMISGFFMEDRFVRFSSFSPKKTIIKLVKLILWSNLLYFIWGILLHHFYLHSKTISELFLYLTGGNDWPEKLKSYLLLHSNLVYKGYHLWYLNAMLYAWTIVYCIKRFFKEKGTKLLHFFIPVLLVYSVLQSNYASLLFGKFDALTTRNFLFCGIPYISLGGWIYQKQKKLRQLFSVQSLFFIFAVLSIAVCLEEHLLSSVRTSKAGDYYICTAFQAIAMFLLFLKIHHDYPGARCLKPFARIGKQNTLYIYILHTLFHQLIWHLLVFFKIIHIYNLFNIEPIVVFFVTLIASELVIRFQKVISHKKLSKAV